MRSCISHPLIFVDTTEQPLPQQLQFMYVGSRRGTCGTVGRIPCALQHPADLQQTTRHMLQVGQDAL